MKLPRSATFGFIVGFLAVVLSFLDWGSDGAHTYSSVSELILWNGVIFLVWGGAAAAIHFFTTAKKKSLA